MAIRKIARMGHPVLRQRAAEIADPRDPEIQALIADMIETMADADGLGLAAPQVHVPKRLVIFHVPGAGEDDGDDEAGLTVLMNPVITPLSDEMSAGWEGCLSVPGLRGRVSRHHRIRYRGLDREGRTIEREAEGLHARVVQHECDHLDGILYPMRMDDLRDLIFETEWRHHLAPADAETEEREAAE